MKTFQCSLVKLLMIAIACSFAPSATVQAGASSWSSAPPNDVARLAGNARLFVWRAADFGTEIYLVLYIDGVRVTTLGRNEGFHDPKLRPFCASRQCALMKFPRLPRIPRGTPTTTGLKSGSR
jgi:hypothetical protein